jgi:hypothetical protein
MATKVIVCPECEAALVPGRFSCSSCGALLARVASETRSFTRPESAMPPVVEAAPPAIEAASDETEEHEAAEPDDAIVASVDSAEPARAEPEQPAWPGQQAWPQQPAWPGQAASPDGPAWPDQPAWPPAREAPAAPAEPLPPVAPPEPPRTPAGAYLPPSAVLPPGEALPLNGTNGSSPVAREGAKPRASLTERLAIGEGDGPLGLPANAPGRTIALGAALAGFGFILPWAEIVIGSGSIGSFLDQWGLAAPGHALVFLLLIGVGTLAVAHERLPIHVHAGLPSIVLGSVLLGLVFPYVMGPFREAVGVYVVVAGAVVMIVGGLLTRMTSRHADGDATV